MAEFCKKCSEEMNLPYEYTPYEEICEGCGKTFTDRPLIMKWIYSLFKKNI